VRAELSREKETFELEQRRAELTQSLPALSENQAEAYRRNSDARSATALEVLPRPAAI
jgi:hypothetical protein